MTLRRRTGIHPVVLLLLAAFLPAWAVAACGGGGGGSQGSPSPFFVQSTWPVDGARDVPLEGPVQVVLSLAVDPGSVHAGTLRVGVAGGAGEIAGSVTLLGDGRTVRWVPTDAMASDAPHGVLVASDLRSQQGDRVGGALAFGFSTLDLDPEVVLPRSTQLRNTIGRLQVGRRSHRATVLEDGEVLVTGGFQQGTEISDRGERFDPVFEQFVFTTGAMTHERASHTATRLQDGRVLLTGGWYEVAPGLLAVTASAELYDPSTDEFSPAGDMSTARVDHAAALLPDGRVLVSGGSRIAGVFLEDLDTAEVFDPATGAFTPLPARMVHPRALHAMVDVGGGFLVLAGGSDQDLRYGRFDVAREVFEPLAPPVQEEARWAPAAATFASGGLCVAGGDPLGTVAHVWPGIHVVQSTGSGLSARRSYATATRIASNRILVAGGLDVAAGLFLLSTIDLVVEDPITGSRTFETTMRFPTGIAMHAAVRLQDGRVLFCGGLNALGGWPELTVAYLFTP